MVEPYDETSGTVDTLCSIRAGLRNQNDRLCANGAQVNQQGPTRLHVEAEIASQPDSWRRVAELAGALGDLLPPGRIALTGCGTSFYVAQAVAVAWENAGLGVADAFAASEMPVRTGYDTVVVISRSGTTTEVVDLLHRLEGVRTLALVGSAGPVSAAASDLLELGFADERSVVQTRFATSVIALFRALAGDDVVALAERAAGVLAEPATVPVLEASRFVFLGTGAAVGLAHEAALKMREAARAVTESYPAMEYRHGPIALAEPGVVVWILGPAPAGLVDDVRRTGAAVVDDDLDPLVDLVRVQSVAVALARARGYDADNPRNLTRAVLLADSTAHEGA
jgi:fructoselysine-6-P-deglycase FrlB-like protein